MNERRGSRLLRSVAVALPFAAALSLCPTAAHAQTVTTETFGGISGVLYRPAGFNGGSNFSAVVMMHGCSGMWSGRDPTALNGNGTPNLQNNVVKWGLQLAAEGIAALAVDSFTARTPMGVSDSDWQNQCSGATYAGSVDSYTTRADDAMAAYDFLDTFSEIDESNIALLGWSHGAQAAMVQAAETSRTVDTPRSSGDLVFAATVLFYPGCGTALGFGNPSTGYWRPYADLMFNIGESDGFYSNCEDRVDRAIGTYSAPVTFAGFPGAGHSFDGGSQTWPVSACGTPNDDCAMRTADIDSLDFLLNHI